MRGVFQATIVDASGSVVSEANIEVKDETTGELVQVYEEFEEGEAFGNPFLTDTEGFTRFYLEDGLYRIRAYNDTFEREWRHVHIGLGAHITSGSFEATLTGMSSATTGTINWRKHGTLVTLYVETAILGTSNAGTFTITGLPANLQPANLVTVPCTGLVENFVQHMGVIRLTAGSGTITPFFHDGDGLSSAWTASGDKGLDGGWQAIYDTE